MEISNLASIATIILALAAIISGAVYIRDLDNRIGDLESPAVVEARDKALEAIREAASDALDPLPSGTIIASLPEPTLFLDGREDKWHLADASTIPSGKFLELAKSGTLELADNTRLPDLRGMFLRGQNHGRNDGKQDPALRQVGSYQSAATSRPTQPFIGEITESGEHKHEFDAAMHFEAGESGHPRAKPAGRPAETSEVGSHHMHTVEITKGGDAETRPANVSVYFLH